MAGPVHVYRGWTRMSGGKWNMRQVKQNGVEGRAVRGGTGILNGDLNF